jgi:hypothetical protein
MVLNMNIEAIPKDQIEDCLKAEALMRELVVRLTMYKEDQEKQLERLERIKTVCEQLAIIKAKTGFKYPEDIRKEVNKRIDRYVWGV